MIENYNISKRDTHVGIIEFSNQANVILQLNKLFEQTSIQDQVKRIIPSGGKQTVTDEALRKSADDMFDVTSGGRPGATKVLIIVTDGKSTGKEPPKRAVKPVKEKGVRVYVVNIGEDTDKDELKDIVPTERNIYPAKTSGKVPSIAPKLFDDIEKDIKKRELFFFNNDRGNKDMSDLGKTPPILRQNDFYRPLFLYKYCFHRSTTHPFILGSGD